MSRLFMVTAAMAVALCAQACATFDQVASVISGRPVAVEEPLVLTGDGLELRAYAAVALWAALQSEAMEIIEAPETPDSLREIIRRIDAAGSPAMTALARRAATHAGAHDDVLLAAALAEGNQHIEAMSAAIGAALETGMESEK